MQLAALICRKRTTQKCNLQTRKSIKMKTTTRAQRLQFIPIHFIALNWINLFNPFKLQHKNIQKKCHTMITTKTYDDHFIWTRWSGFHFIGFYYFWLTILSLPISEFTSTPPKKLLPHKIYQDWNHLFATQGNVKWVINEFICIKNIDWILNGNCSWNNEKPSPLSAAMAHNIVFNVLRKK